MSFKSAVAVFSAAALIAGQAAAASTGATVTAINGDALVMSGKAPAAAQAGATLNAGDRLVVRKGDASVRFADGCTIKLGQGTMATISAKSPCAGGQAAISTQSGQAAQWYKMNGPWDTGAFLAAGGVVILVAAVAYGITDPTKCKGTTNSDGSCTPSP